MTEDDSVNSIIGKRRKKGRQKGGKKLRARRENNERRHAKNRKTRTKKDENNKKIFTHLCCTIVNCHLLTMTREATKMVILAMLLNIHKIYALE